MRNLKWVEVKGVVDLQSIGVLGTVTLGQMKQAEKQRKHRGKLIGANFASILSSGNAYGEASLLTQNTNFETKERWKCRWQPIFQKKVSYTH